MVWRRETAQEAAGLPYLDSLNLDGPGYAGEPGIWDEVQVCTYVVFHGSPNPDSARFGPDEECGEDAVEDTDRCEKHTGRD